MATLTFKYDKLPVSVNKMYVPRGNYLTLSSEAKKWKQEFVMSRGGADPVGWLSFKPSGPKAVFRLELAVHVPYEKAFFKNGKVRKFDVANLYKIFADTVAQLTGIDDRAFFENVQIKKVLPEGATPFLEASLTEIECPTSENC